MLWLFVCFLDWFCCVLFNFRRERELQKTNKFKKRPPLRRGRVSPWLSVPGDIPKPPYSGSEEMPETSSEHQIHESEGIVKMRAAYELGAHVLENAGKFARACLLLFLFIFMFLFYSNSYTFKFLLTLDDFGFYVKVRSFA